MKRACNRFFGPFLVAAILLACAGRGLAQPPGDSTAQQLRQEMESLRTEWVRQHRELSARNEALRQELARNQQESQALLDQLLEAQTQLSQARSGEEMARCRADQEALRAQLAERKAAITYMEQAYESQLADARQENEALLAQLLAAQTQVRNREPETASETAIARSLPGHSPATAAQNIRDFFAKRKMFPSGEAMLKFDAALLPEVYPAPVQVRFFIETDDLGETWVKCFVKTESGVYLSDLRATAYYDRVHALLGLIFFPK